MCVYVYIHIYTHTYIYYTYIYVYMYIYIHGAASLHAHRVGLTRLATGCAPRGARARGDGDEQPPFHPFIMSRPSG